MTDYTPTPWEISELRTTDDTPMIVGGEEFKFGLIADVTEDEDAAFIVKAVNAHEALVKALQDVHDELEDGNLKNIRRITEQALALSSEERE